MSETEELKSIVKCLTELVKVQKEQNQILSKQLESIDQQLKQILYYCDHGIRTC